MRNKRTKNGFTLIELIVVLAILAIIAAIAIPAAFGSLEKAKDTAARTSVGNIVELAKRACALVQLDKKLIESMSGNGAKLTFYAKKGVFELKSSVPAGGLIDNYLLDQLNDSAIQMGDKAEVVVEVGFDKNGKMTSVMVSYCPEGQANEPVYFFRDDAYGIVRIPAL